MSVKARMWLHLLAQILAQAAIAAIVPAAYDKYYAAAVALVGVMAAFFDTSASQGP